MYQIRMQCTRSCARPVVVLRAASVGQLYVRYVVQVNVAQFSTKLKQDTGIVGIGAKKKIQSILKVWAFEAQSAEADALGAIDTSPYGNRCF